MHHLCVLCVQAAAPPPCGPPSRWPLPQPGAMPDVKPPPPHDYPSTCSAGAPPGSPLDLGVDMEPCVADLPPSPDPLSFPQRGPGLAHYPPFYGAPFPLMARCNSSTLLTNLGVRCCSSRLGSVGAGVGAGSFEAGDPGSPGHAGGNGQRPYRSMENLNWSSLADSRQCGVPYGSVDGELILSYTSTSHWCGAAAHGSMARSLELMPGPESLAFYPRHALPRKDLPLFPQLLLPAGVDEWDARKGLRDKLRLQSARSSLEPLKPLPLRAQMTPSSGSRPVCAVRLTSPEEIKQEVLRRLQLRRQNSSPDLARHGSFPPGSGAVKGSHTTDSVANGRNHWDGSSERSRAPAGRLHIPTFEEFKRMRQQEGEQRNHSAAGPAAPGKPEAAELNGSVCPSDPSDSMSSGGDLQNSEAKGERSKSDTTGSSGEAAQTASTSEGPSHGHPASASSTTAPASTSPSSPSSVSSTYSPIRTGPSPRSPLQPQASSAQERAAQCGGGRRRRCSLEPAGSVPFPPGRENWGRPASCCPALLLEGTDLSSYGAKIYKMKDGLIGSALDLIKKRWVRVGGLAGGSYAKG